MNFSDKFIYSPSKNALWSIDFKAEYPIFLPQFLGLPIAITTSYSCMREMVNNVINPTQSSSGVSIKKKRLFLFR